MSATDRKLGLRLLILACTVAMAATVTMAGWTVKETVDMGKDIAGMKAKSEQPDDPPAWFIKRIDALESRMDKRMDRIESKLGD